MAEDWSINVKKYVPDADDGIIAGIVRYCGIALQKRDSSLVSFGDSKETDRVRENYLKKKLALTDSDSALDAAIASVGERMKGENFKNRVTVYYLLAEHFGKLGLFAKAGAAVAGGAAAAGAGAAVAGLASLGDKEEAEPVAAPEPAAAAPVAAMAAVGAAAAGGAAAAASPVAETYRAADVEAPSGGLGWLKWLLLALAALLLLWWLFFRQPAAAPTAEPAPEETAAAVAPEASAPATPPPAEGTVTIPTGAGVTTETRDGKPVVKVYFDTGKANIVDAFAPAAGAMKAYLDSHAGSTLGVSGFADKRGNAAANAALSKRRAEAVKAALVTTGIPDASIELVKPAESVENTDDLAGARRVEVFVK